MGHAVFIVLHFLAFMCGFFGLFITIPLHVIYATIANKNKEPAPPQNVGHLIGLSIRVVLIFIAGFIVFLILSPVYIYLKSNISWLR
ncbi:hypothetical protein UFOVP1565_18 [uncultured Caudovirales phage]|jgi:hypothetical protein|uniref:DUF4870 domain-containing protein n=1 Tax=uncultured Caudovirales phage TaxID=2100421 RepID=A0A6J5LPZ3_9CAUD|nr:hypothetical protein UFOVP311_34 [uncultured Caudovirales phage]CAB4203875.1 hypothetical protein UFOVP1388_13 [uncultured Caudovirales phage]CAB5229810.1 hypothetical protein UFOVP1565_18 [uncultured Caudovirales phage]